MDSKQLDDLKPNPKNPRRMSKHDADALKNSMKSFGDLAVVVFNIQTQQMVGGHQRLETVKRIPAEKRVLLTQQAEAGSYLDDVQTTALGYIFLGNKQFAYREVDWPYEKELAANIAANRIQGEFDLDLLAESNQFLEDTSPDLLDLTGQTETEVKHLKKKYGPDDPEDTPPKNDDGSRPFEIRVSEAQLNRILEAVGAMKRERQLTMEQNTDLDGNAIYYICETYLAAQNEQPAPPAPAA